MSRTLTIAAAVAALSLAVPRAAVPQQETGEARFYGREQFTVVGTQTGAESGGFTTYVRDWGRLSAEVKDTTIAVLGMSQRQRTRVVNDGAEVITIDLDTGAVTVTANPIYGPVVEAMRGRDGAESGREIMTRMGAQATGESGSYAGHECSFWEIAQLGSRLCVTDWGATLYSLTLLGGATVERTVTEVRMNDGGPDDVYEYDASGATRMPSFEDILRMRGR